MQVIRWDCMCCLQIVERLRLLDMVATNSLGAEEKTLKLSEQNFASFTLMGRFSIIISFTVLENQKINFVYR